MSNPKDYKDLTDQQLEASALAALGCLTPQEAMALPRRAVAEMEQSAALLAESVTQVPPRDELRQRLLERVAAFEELRPVADVRRDENTWSHSGIPGVAIKTLLQEPQLGRSTYLVRMDPGSRLPAHRHGDTEQCLVIEGDIRWGDLTYEKGDFVAMGKGTEHPEVHTVGGNLLLIIAGHNEFHQSV
jgi:anti-sigma factor ChrR (cupin superfamily)